MVLSLLAAIPAFMASWGPVIGAAATVAGTVISAVKANEPQPPQVTRNEVDYVAMRRNAEKAGINPLAALRNGGAQGHAVTYNPVFNSTVSPLGEGLQAIGGAVSSFDWSGQSQKRAVLENDLLTRQIMDLSGNIHKKSSGPYGVKGVGPWGVAEPEPVVQIRTLGMPWDANPGWSNTQEFEDRYGDPLSWLYGVPVLLDDTKRTLDKKTWELSKPVSEFYQWVTKSGERNPQNGADRLERYKRGAGYVGVK